jgi:hypothetical protein
LGVGPTATLNLQKYSKTCCNSWIHFDRHKPLLLLLLHVFEILTVSNTHKLQM